MYSKVIDNVSVAQHQSLPSSMEVHLVDKNDIFYKKGRVLAEDIYRTVWNTENLIDGNDYGVVVMHNNDIVGNMNLQVKQNGKSLKSEIFFGEKHWQPYWGDFVTSTNIAEVSALAIDDDIAKEIRRPVMMMLILGMQNLCRLQNIEYLVTIQHEFLIRILRKTLDLPFWRNESVTIPKENLPKDDYWNRHQHPGLYYLEPLSFAVTDACYSFLSYLTSSGIQTSLIPRPNLTHGEKTYNQFRRSWKNKALVKSTPNERVA
ncbi:MAG: hypothetical protein WBM32_20995 [Crocosphaera sp.]